VTVAEGRAAVEAYLAAQSPEGHELLADLRRRVMTLVPEAVDAMGYGMPMLRVDGKGLIWFASWKRHCSVYPVGSAFIAAHPELAGHGYTDKGALHFSADQPLSDPVVADLVRERLADLGAGAA
jgi:uncharacterized protein YdhG (YjbR/CyaY superfamily)